MTKEMSAKNIVLYADDDMDDIQLVREAFFDHSKNVELVTVADGVEIVSFLKNLSIDDPAPCLIILDINMPRLNGKETLAKIREMKRFEEVPTILFTTSSQKQDKDFAQKHNAGFITKPIDYNQMDIIVNTFIKHCSDEVRKNISRKIR